TMREAARMVGRPDIGICNWASTAEKTDVIIALADPTFGSIINDGVLFAAVAEMKVDQERLKKVSYCMQRGFILEALLGPLMGGYAGGPEGTAICLAAHYFLATLVYRTDICCTFPIHINHCTSNTPEVLWLTSLVNQGLARNCNILKLTSFMSHAGPNTQMCMNEAAAYGLTATVSGADALDLGAMTMNRHPMRWAVQEPKMAAEVGHIAARMGITRKDANDIVKSLVAEYEPMLGSVAKGENRGSRWDECYDIERLVPTDDYAQLVSNMKKKMGGFGLDWNILRTEL
ncbi:MAG: monomethylamine:corrinoid methyltransferase, partial [Clostridiales bacterium]